MKKIELTLSNGKICIIFVDKINYISEGNNNNRTYVHLDSGALTVSMGINDVMNLIDSAQ